MMSVGEGNKYLLTNNHAVASASLRVTGEKGRISLVLKRTDLQEGVVGI